MVVCMLDGFRFNAFFPVQIFADMEELGIRPNVSIVSMVGKVFQELDMLDKYKKLKKKYPPPKWEYRYIKGKRVRIRAKDLPDFDNAHRGVREDDESNPVLVDETSVDLLERTESSSNRPFDEPEEVDQNSNRTGQTLSMALDEKK